MGLGNDVFNELKKTVINLDNDESDNDVIKFNVAEDIKKLYCEKELLSIRHGNNNLDKYVAENDLEKLPYMLSKSEKEAEKVAQKRYSKSKTKSKKNNCSTGLCVIFACDEENGFADVMTCHNSCKVHTRCEGIVYVSEDYEVEERYTCNNCKFGEHGKKSLEQLLKEGVDKIKNENREIMRRLTEINIQIEKRK